MKRTAKIVRKTRETQIELKLELDGTGKARVSTGIPFLNHMLELLARHSLIDLQVKATGDVAVDYHHLVEDLGIALGEAFRKALGDKKGIRRYGFWLLPMDETLVRVALDFSGRPYLVYRVRSRKSKVRDFSIALIREFMQGFSNSAACNLHIELIYGDEPHHIVEGVFKGLAKSIDLAKQKDSRIRGIPSTKGML